MLNSQIVDSLQEQALVWIAYHFPLCQTEDIPVYQEVYVNQILSAVADQL